MVKAHVQRRTPKFRALTAQWDKMSGASLALRTSTPRTPSGTWRMQNACKMPCYGHVASSSPLTAPLKRIVGVWKTSPCTPVILSMSCKTPLMGLSIGEIICQGGRCAKSRKTGSMRCRIRLTAIKEVPLKTSSTKTSMFFLGASMAVPKKAALGPSEHGESWDS